MIKVGIVGGRARSTMAGFQALENVEVAAVCDLNEETMNKIGDQFNIPHRYRVFEDMLESDIDAVVIASPMQCHVPQAIAALEAGKHVMSEVTAGVTMDELWWLIEAKEKYGKTYMMAENYIYSPQVQLVKALREAGEFGTPFYAEGEYLHDVSDMAVYDNGKLSWRSFWQLGKRGSFYPTHSLGPVMEWFSGDRVTEISCFGTGGQFWTPELRQDELTVTMCRMESGALAKITVACKAPRPHNMHTYLLQGTKGCFEASRGMDGKDKIWLENHPLADQKPGDRVWRPLEDFNDYLPERYKNPCEAAKKAGHQGGDFYIVKDFIDAITTGEEPSVNVYRACEWTAVGLLSELSVTNGGRAIEVPNFRKNMKNSEKLFKI